LPGRGKYSSKVNSCGTPESEKENSKEESLQGVWWWYLTSHPHSGIRHHGKLFEERHGPESVEPVDMQAALDGKSFAVTGAVCSSSLSGLEAFLKGHKRHLALGQEF